jgi:hypothetical protein
MAGILRTDTIQNSNTSTIITQTNSTTITIGTTGQTVALASGASSSGFGATYNGAVNWDTTAKTTGFTAVSGVGYFCNTTSSAFTVTLPSSPSAGAIVAVSDYANTFATNNLTIARNGSNIGGAAANSILSTNGISITFVYVDSTQGWIVTDSGNRSELPTAKYVAATGGTITTCGDYKIHSFTGPGTFTVSCAGNPAGSSTVDYLIVAGGGGGGADGGGGGGAGGFRESKATGAPWTASPLASSTSLPVSATGYPITVGGGGAGSPNSLPGQGTSGNNSIFSTITSTAGGGAGGMYGPGAPTATGLPGGSGGGISRTDVNPGATAGIGNTPPVSPPQGNTGGGISPNPSFAGGAGGGGATVVGAAGNTGVGGNGGNGATTSISGSPTAYAGGGGGAGWPTGSTGGTGGTGGGATGGGYPSPAGPATANRGGGGGGGAANGTTASSGSSGIVVIRYKFQ